ncbi:MAG: diguanylate cyclase [Polyangiales bacterium]
MNLSDLRVGYNGISYYPSDVQVRQFVAVPVREDDRIVGVLCADRIAGLPFSELEVQALVDSSAQICRALENERVFMQLERGKREQELLFRASQQLGTALDKESVIDAGLQAAAEIAPYDFAALSEYQPEGKRHRVTRAVGENAEKFAGLEFRENHSLVSMVVKNRHYLPYRGEFDSKQQMVFTARKNIQSMGSVLILPLVVREEPIGTLVLATKRGQAYGDRIRTTLHVLANQLAAALANAAAVKRLEELATTDGLTGCMNKRAFLEEMQNKILAAERFGRKLSLIVIDLDHFKSINDTHGHATGDRVLKELGHILRSIKRETDVVGRFGGEEFCVLCEETDTRGAVNLAERIREELSSTPISTDSDPLFVTASVGVATFPDHARNSDQLFEVSDKALYFAKENGRDRVCAA